MIEREPAEQANTAGLTNAFLTDLMKAMHNFGTTETRGGTGADAFKLALFLASASRGPSDTVYNTTGEHPTSGNYTQGGTAVTNANPPALDGTVAHWTPSASVAWPNLTTSAAIDAAVLYNDTYATKREVAVFNFGSQTVTGGTFTLTMPTNDGTTGLVRLANS